MKRQRKIELLPQIVESLVGDTRDVFLLFVDLCRSTEYKMNCIAQGQPDSTWILRQLIFLQGTASLVKQYHGIVVKTIGDELFAYFEATTDPESVLKCAIAIIQSYENLKAYQRKSKLEARVSIDIGPTYNGSILSSVPFDPIGSPVDRCARLNSVAKNNEIVFSDDFLASMETKLSQTSFKSKYGYKTHSKNLKGFEKTKLYSILVK
ncbi:adenylate/guanylate cyclase domain-containing protein [bacterium]|nr:adenylate/guanylate cyclase domain-containing protein [bacterium]